MTAHKIAFVVQRYGEDVVGGAEALCRQLAEGLTGRVRIDVLTTCARDYHSWAGFYPAGKMELNSVPVYRFPVDYRRRRYFTLLNRLVHRGVPLPRRLEEIWMRAQGPYSSRMLSYIREHRDGYRLFVFFTYLYCPTYFGLSLAGRKSVLVPTAHDEPPLKLKIFQTMFDRPGGFVFLTPEEKELVSKTFVLGERETMIAGAGIELPPKEGGEIPVFLNGQCYLLYLGRVDPGKNTDRLFHYFRRYRREHPDTPLKLVLAGHSALAPPADENILYLGFVSEAVKYGLIDHALALVQPSAHESLSLVALEAMAMATPVIVNGDSPVLAGHCRRSGGGFCYRNYDQFAYAVDRLAAPEPLRPEMGRRGSGYVRKYYSREAVEDSWIRFLNAMCTRLKQ